VTTKGSLRYRPRNITEITNLFLAGDFVITTSEVALMEAANESGRAAAKAVILSLNPQTPKYALPKVFEHKLENLHSLLNFHVLKELDQLKRWEGGLPFGWDMIPPTCSGDETHECDTKHSGFALEDLLKFWNPLMQLNPIDI